MTTSLNPPTVRTYQLGPVKPWVQQAGILLGSLFNIQSEGGVRADPLPDHPSGHAVDFMVTNPGTPAGYAQGDALANYAVQHYRELGIKYIIWNKRYWDPQQGWGPYTAPSVIAYNPHTNHVHITFQDQAGAWTGAGGLPSNIVLTSAQGGGASGSTGDPNAVPANSDLCAWNLSLPILGNNCIFTKVFLREASGWALMLVGGTGVLFGLALIAAFTFGSLGAKTAIRGAGLGKLSSRLDSSTS